MNIADLNPYTVELARKEVSLLASLDHPGIVKMFEHCEDASSQQIVLVLEYMNGGNCESLYQPGKPPPREGLVARILIQVLEAVHYCHEHGIIHKDLKPENLMLNKVDGWATPQCKIIDFNIAVQGKPGEVMQPPGCGTPAYSAPEALSHQPYTSKVDVWSVGACAFEMLVGQAPFGGSGRAIRESIADRVREYETLENLQPTLRAGAVWLWRFRSAESHDFVNTLMCIDPDERPTAAEALDHPFLQRHRVEQPHLTPQIAKGLAAFAAAPAVARCCALLLASRLNVEDGEMLGAVFIGADRDGDGLLSRADLEGALSDMGGSSAGAWWPWAGHDSQVAAQVDIDVEKVLAEVDLDHTGGISYSEFVASSIYARYRSLENLARQAFHALDIDRDGMVRVPEVIGLFRERDMPLLGKLPQHRPFQQVEWCAALEQHARAEQHARSVGSHPSFSHRRVRTMP
jgi:Ca2+-binding EF-hand superfamily protein